MARLDRFRRQQGRDDFDDALERLAGVEVPSLADCVLSAAQRSDLTNAQLGAYVRGLVDGYLKRWAEREASGD